METWDLELKPPSWAVVTGSVSGLVVLDADTSTAINYIKQLGLQPNIKTGSGGYHVYLDHPGFPVHTLNSKSKLELWEKCPGLDMRADGGYALFSGTNQHGPYEVLRPLNQRASLNSLPDDMRKTLGITPPGRNGSNANGRVDISILIDKALERIPAEGRNNAGFWLATQLRDNGYSEDECRAVGRRFVLQTPVTNTKGNQESYTDRDFEQSVRQAYSSPARDPWTSRAGGQMSEMLRGQGEEFTVTDPVNKEGSPRTFFLSEDALYGLPGEFVRLVEPHSEADPAALLFQFLAAAGAFVGKNPYYPIESDRHHLNLFVCVAGKTAKSRKGTSWGHVRKVLRLADPEWAAKKVTTGLSSGEGLIWVIRDPIVERKQVNGRYEQVLTDPGEEDKRLLVVEPEFARVLQAMQRDSNTLSAILRQAFDGHPLNTLIKKQAAACQNPHVAIICHITVEELLKTLNQVEQANGFANRFLFCHAERSKCLPFGGNLNEDDLKGIAEKLKEAESYASKCNILIRFNEETRGIWESNYPGLSADTPGLLGGITSRAEAHVVRLAALYAILDLSEVIAKEHLAAALSVWEYARASAALIFGDAIGDATADSIRQLLIESRSGGCSRTEISNHFKKHKTASEIERALNLLRRRGYARFEIEATDGRSVERWCSVSNAK